MELPCPFNDFFESVIISMTKSPLALLRLTDWVRFVVTSSLVCTWEINRQSPGKYQMSSAETDWNNFHESCI